VKDGGAEDIEIAKCLRKAGVYPGKSVDGYNRERFHHLTFTSHFRGQFADWFIDFAENKPVAVSSIFYYYLFTLKFSLFSFRVQIVAVIQLFLFIMLLPMSNI
jgi:hypothetical protein